MNTFEFALDLSKQTAMEPLRLRQGDKNGTEVRATIYDHGTLVTGSYTSRICLSLPDGEHYYRKAGTFSAGVATVTIDEQEAASVVGRSYGYIQLLSGSTVIASTASFPVLVLPDATAEATVPESYDTAIQEAIDGLNEAVADLPDTVEDVLEQHPEWTTTVQDNSLTDAKLVQSGGILSRNQRLMYRLANLLTHRTDEGTLAAISDAAKTPMAGLSVYGLSTQDGTPTPEAPVPIESVEGDSEGNISLWASGKNLLDLAANVDTSAHLGISKTINADGSLTFSGTAVSTYTYITNEFLLALPSGTYTLSISQTLPYSVYLTVWFKDGTAVNHSILVGQTIKTFEITKPAAKMRVAAAYMTANTSYNETFTIQMERGSSATAYAPYTGTTTPIDLDGHELRSLPDGTRDELTVDALGHVTLVQRVQLTTQAVTDGVTGTVGVDVMSSTGEIANGSTVLYALATPVTYDLGTVPLVPLVGPDLTAQTVPTAPFVLDAERDLNVTLARLESAIAALA